ESKARVKGALEISYPGLKAAVPCRFPLVQWPDGSMGGWTLVGSAPVRAARQGQRGLPPFASESNLWRIAASATPTAFGLNSTVNVRHTGCLFISAVRTSSKLSLILLLSLLLWPGCSPKQQTAKPHI